MIPVQTLYTNALMLNLQDRAILLNMLMESIEKTNDAEIEKAWLQTAKIRLEQLLSNKVQPVPWAEIKKNVISDVLHLIPIPNEFKL